MPTLVNNTILHAQYCTSTKKSGNKDCKTAYIPDPGLHSAAHNYLET